MLTLSIKMPLSEALMISLIGLITVIIALAVIAGLIILVSKAVRALEAAVKKDEPQPAAAPAASPAGQNRVELIDTDEKTAAVVMAIVSQKSGIPLNRLSFKSIKLIQDEKKGDR